MILRQVSYKPHPHTSAHRSMWTARAQLPNTSLWWTWLLPSSQSSWGIIRASHMAWPPARSTSFFLSPLLFKGVLYYLTGLLLQAQAWPLLRSCAGVAAKVYLPRPGLCQPMVADPCLVLKDSPSFEILSHQLLIEKSKLLWE